MSDRTILHRSLEELNTAFDARPSSPLDKGALEMIVVRPEENLRETPRTIRITSEAGLANDHWAKGANRDRQDTQVTIINARVLDVVSGGRDRWALAGDNLVADLDLSPDNLPAGQRLSVGSVVLEMTGVPHTGCTKFAERYGADGLRFVNTRRGRDLRFRGVYAEVVASGSVTVGDVISKA